MVEVGQVLKDGKPNQLLNIYVFLSLYLVEISSFAWEGIKKQIHTLFIDYFFVLLKKTWYFHLWNFNKNIRTLCYTFQSFLIWYLVDVGLVFVPTFRRTNCLTLFGNKNSLSKGNHGYCNLYHWCDDTTSTCHWILCTSLHYCCKLFIILNQNMHVQRENEQGAQYDF